MPRKELSMTARRIKLDLLTRQLKATALFQLQTMRSFMAKCNTADEIRAQSRVLRTNSVAYNTFFNIITDQYKHIAKLIQLAARTYVDLIQINDCVVMHEEGEVVSDAINKLWVFLLRSMYEKPVLVMGDDDEYGTAITAMSELMDQFIAESIDLKFASLSSSDLQQCMVNPSSSRRREAEEEEPEEVVVTHTKREPLRVVL